VAEDRDTCEARAAAARPACWMVSGHDFPGARPWADEAKRRTRMSAFHPQRAGGLPRFTKTQEAPGSPRSVRSTREALFPSPRPKALLRNPGASGGLSLHGAAAIVITAAILSGLIEKLLCACFAL